jgi:hypothetical protein
MGLIGLFYADYGDLKKFLERSEKSVSSVPSVFYDS